MHSEETLRKSVDSSMRTHSLQLHETILDENANENGGDSDDEISPPLTKTEQELLNNCLYPSANFTCNSANETQVQLVCVEMPTAVVNGELNENVIVVKKEGF